MNPTKKNIIWDLQGVLFKKDSNSLAHYSILEEGYSLLKQCSQHSHYVLSNMRRERLELLQLHYPLIFTHFRDIIISDNVGYSKPDHQIFLHLLNKYNLAPHDCIFIDDTYAHVASALQLGIDALHCNDFEQVTKLLQQRKIIL